MGLKEAAGAREIRLFRSNALRPRLLALGAFGHDGRPKPSAQIVRQLIEFGIAIDFDGFLGGITDNIAVMTPSQVIFELGLGALVDRPVQVVGQFLEEFSTFHLSPSPLARF